MITLILKILGVILLSFFILIALITIVIVLNLNEPDDDDLVNTDYTDTTSDDQNLFI